MLSGMGELHLEVTIERLRREYKVDVNTGRPQVAYRETITASAEKVEGKFIKQTGGSRTVRGRVHRYGAKPRQGLRVLLQGQGGQRFRPEYIPAVGKGCELSMGSGVLARYPMEDVKVTLTDGKYHDTDSSEIAFQMAGAAAFKAACHRCKPVILEPIMSVEVTVPEDGLGWATGDITRRRVLSASATSAPGASSPSLVRCRCQRCSATRTTSGLRPPAGGTMG